METKRLLFGEICGFRCFPNKCVTTATRCQIFFLLKNSLRLIFSNYLPQFRFSTIVLVTNGHRAIKVHVNKVQYCRAGHIFNL